jgi:hypothetical protein
MSADYIAIPPVAPLPRHSGIVAVGMFVFRQPGLESKAV